MNNIVMANNLNISEFIEENILVYGIKASKIQEQGKKRAC